MVKELNEAEFETVRKNGTLVVDFNATWCGPCRMLAPILEEISEELKDVSFFSIDVDACPNLAKEFGIISIPFVAVLKDGELKGSNIGFIPKEGMKSFIESNI